MRILLYTSEDCLQSELFRYLYGHVAANFGEVEIVAVRRATRSIWLTLKRYWAKCRRLGFFVAAEIVTGQLLAAYLTRRDDEEIEELLHRLDRPSAVPDLQKVHIVASVNGLEATQTIRNLQPDVIIQAGAGILRPNIFVQGKIGTLNLHHGIAPLIRGVSSIRWALLEERTEWIGSTIHWIDEGIDTGGVLAYHFVEPAGFQESTD
jgi:hypothetical protein